VIKLLLVDDQVLFVETLQTVISMKAEDIDMLLKGALLVTV
jgi:hypothetical protein